jgi:hypothetical protein
MPAPNEKTADNEELAASGAADLNSVLNDSQEAEFVYEEQKKPAGKGLLALLGLLAVAGGGLYLMSVRAGPSRAAANPEVESANKTISQFLSKGPDNVKAMEAMLRDTEKVVQQFLAYPSVTQVPLEELKTNPFRHEISASKTADASRQQLDAERRRKEEERQKVLKAVQSLQLRSIIHSGTRRACLINNTLYLEGQNVEGFVIEKINPGSVVVKQDAYRFELRLQQ